MPFLLDTDITIHVRDGNETVAGRLITVTDRVAISLVTMIELQAGLATQPIYREQRRLGMTRIARRFPQVKLDQQIVDAYGDILEQTGYLRTRVLDRLIAATAIVDNLTLITMNGPDFRDIPGLKLEVWPAPAQ